ncbi:MAG: ribonuclease domain-containing protein [Lachnospira sp.]
MFLNRMKKLWALVLSVLLLLMSACGFSQADVSDNREATLGSETVNSTDVTEETSIPENGTYTSKEDVALFLHTYGHLPDNFIDKSEAEKLGWSGGSLEPFAPGKCIGGSYFGNYEKKLPVKDGRKYYECDIDTLGAKSRGAKRLVYSNDGLIYFTEDHYETFVLLYGKE